MRQVSVAVVTVVPASERRVIRVSRSQANCDDGNKEEDAEESGKSDVPRHGGFELGGGGRRAEDGERGGGRQTLGEREKIGGLPRDGNEYGDAETLLLLRYGPVFRVLFAHSSRVRSSRNPVGPTGTEPVGITLIERFHSHFGKCLYENLLTITRKIFLKLFIFHRINEI